ncbi:MAG TPA: hypothetical protein VNF71_10615 [Acidimicrobiales bacterium]|nr:hypothetical protein [Acidimicrobiales bacterium]
MRRVLTTLPSGAEPDLSIGDRSEAAGLGVTPARPEALRTEFDFELPRGYLDQSGVLHKTGTMRLATARDELLPLHDDRVRENPAYLTVVLLARVITRLGTIEGDDVRASVIENLFASDLAFLQDLYRRINTEGSTRAAVTCPSCHERFTVDLAGGRPGES